MLGFFRERARSKSVSARNLEHSINDHEQELCEVICCTGLPSILLNVLVELCNLPCQSAKVRSDATQGAQCAEKQALKFAKLWLYIEFKTSCGQASCSVRQASFWMNYDVSGGILSEILTGASRGLSAIMAFVGGRRGFSRCLAGIDAACRRSQRVFAVHCRN